MEAPETNPELTKYDGMIKECFRKGLNPIMKALIGLEINDPVYLSDNIQLTSRREPDLLLQFKDEAGNLRILQIEFQSSSDSEMLKRMYLYSAFIYDKYDTLPVQIVLYLGSTKHSMRSAIAHETNLFSYRIISLNEVSSEVFLNSEHPAATVLAILCKYHNSEALINQIFERLLKCNLDR